VAPNQPELSGSLRGKGTFPRYGGTEDLRAESVASCVEKALCEWR